MEGTRDRILREALSLFSEQGSDGGSMRELAQRAGVNVATAYHHFGSKRGLVLALFREFGFIAAIERPVEQATAHLKGTPRQLIEQMLFDTWTLMSIGAEFVRFLMLEALTGDREAIAIANEFRDRGQRNLEAALVHTRIATRANAPPLATAMREVVWGVFYEGLMNGTLNEQWLRERAVESARVLAPRRGR
jgi:AcrR family transcriptional regulator